MVWRTTCKACELEKFRIRPPLWPNPSRCPAAASHPGGQQDPPPQKRLDSRRFFRHTRPSVPCHLSDAMLFSALVPSALSASALTLAQAAAPAGGAQPNPLLSTLPTFFFMAVIFYFLLIRPQQKRAKEQAALLSSVRSGDEVVTSGGLHGVVSNARDPESKTVLVKFAENVKIEVDKSAIASVIKADGSNTKAVPVAKS